VGKITDNPTFWSYAAQAMVGREFVGSSTENKTLIEIAKETGIPAHGGCPGYTPARIRFKNIRNNFWAETRCPNCHEPFFMVPDRPVWFGEIKITSQIGH